MEKHGNMTILENHNSKVTKPKHIEMGKTPDEELHKYSLKTDQYLQKGYKRRKRQYKTTSYK